MKIITISTDTGFAWVVAISEGKKIEVLFGGIGRRFTTRQDAVQDAVKSMSDWKNSPAFLRGRK
jgi:hypothetical protein